MPSFGPKSSGIRRELCKELQDVCDAAIMIVDFSLTEGHRDEEDQERMVAKGLSHVHWPDGAHNKEPSDAVHCLPWPWPAHLPLDTKHPDKVREVRELLTMFAGAFRMCGQLLDYDIIWGGDWDGDWRVHDNNFDDMMHFELKR